MIKKHKRALSLVLTFVFLFVSTVIATPVATALTGITNKLANIYSAPYYTSDHIRDTIGINQNVTVIDRELDFLYIYYTKNGVNKSGYIHMNDVNASGYTYHTYTHYESAHNNTNLAIYSYYRPDGDEILCALDPDEGKVYNKPLTVLRQEGEYSFVQYVLNPGNDGTYNVKFERGWVKTSELTLDPKISAVTSPSSATKYYIKNVATGLYLDVSGYTSADGARIQLWDFHGGYNQEFILQPITTTHGSTYVRLLTNMAAANNKAVRVATGAAIMNSNVDLHTVSNLRSQEFYFQPTLDGYYYIRSRCGQNYMMLGVDPNNSGTGSNVLLRYPTSSLYNKWVVEPVYVKNIDYYYNYAYDINNNTYPLIKIPSSMENGVKATFDISDMTMIDNGGLYSQYDFSQYSLNALASWSEGNRGFNLTSNNSSPYKVEFALGYDDACAITDSWYNNDLNSADYGEITQSFISMNYDVIKNYVDTTSGAVFSDVWQGVLVHEIGHTLGLEDIEIEEYTHPNYQTSVMSYGRAKHIVIDPYHSDIAAVKKLYMRGN